MEELGPYAQKRSRNDSTAFQGPPQSRGFLHTNTVITDAATMQHADLSIVLGQIMDRITQLEMQNAVSECQRSEAKIEHDNQVKELTDALAAMQASANVGTNGKKQPVKQDKGIKVRKLNHMTKTRTDLEDQDAVHAQAHALLNVQPTRTGW